jgi:hypothetical protein
MNSRRKFIFDCSAVVAALAVAPMSSLSRSAMGWQAPGQISYPAFVRQVNTIFEVHSSSGRVIKLKLLKVPLTPPTPRATDDSGNEKFSLIFSGPKEVMLTSAIHWFEHDELGRFELYLGQIGTEDRDRVRYESVFNRPGLIT